MGLLVCLFFRLSGNVYEWSIVEVGARVARCLVTNVIPSLNAASSFSGGHLLADLSLPHLKTDLEEIESYLIQILRGQLCLALGTKYLANRACCTRLDCQKHRYTNQDRPRKDRGLAGGVVLCFFRLSF